MPAGLRGDPATALRGLLATWLGDDDAATGAPVAVADAILSSIACHAAHRAGDLLEPSEAGAVLRALDPLAAAGTDPHAAGRAHGRPLLLRLAVHEIGRQLGR